MDKSRVLTRLHFKNWRSLRDVTIDNLTPITVFIGANSSGKTNIIDALHFLRSSITDRSIQETVYRWGGRDKIRTLGSQSKDFIELELSFAFLDQTRTISDKFVIGFDDHGVLFGRRITEDGNDKVLSDV